MYERNKNVKETDEFDFFHGAHRMPRNILACFGFLRKVTDI